MIRRLTASATVLFAVVLGAPQLAGATVTQPTITDISSARFGTVNVTWDDNVADVSSISVTLRDASGATVATNTEDPTATSSTFSDVAGGTGYTAVVTETTPSGDVSSAQSSPVDVVNNYTLGPINANVADITIDPSGATVTATSDNSGWNISWYEVNTNGVDGQYLVQTADGQSCTAPSTNVVGDVATCTVGNLSDPTVAPTVDSITWSPMIIMYDMRGANGGTTTVTSEPTTTPTTQPVVPVDVVSTHAASTLTSGDVTVLAIVGALLLLSGLYGLVLLRNN